MTIAIGVLLLAFAMSFRDVDDAPQARSLPEFVASIRKTGWLRGVLQTLWFVVVFALSILESLGWLLLGVCELSIRFLRWAATELVSMADPPTAQPAAAVL